MPDERNKAYGQYWVEDENGGFVPDDNANKATEPEPVQATAERLDQDT